MDPNRTYPPYPKKFKPGDIAVATNFIAFSDLTSHKAGDKIAVTEDNVSYFNVWYHIYDKEAQPCR